MEITIGVLSVSIFVISTIDVLLYARMLRRWLSMESRLDKLERR